MDASLNKLKENLGKEVKEMEREYTRDEKVESKDNGNLNNLFTLPKKKKNITDGTKQFTSYLTKEQINYITTTAKNAGMTKSEFMQYIVRLAQQTLKID